MEVFNLYPEIEINDLFSLTVALPEEMKKPANVHYQKSGSEAQGKRVAEIISKHL